MLNDLSDYQLIYELLHEGKGGIRPDLEPIGTAEILAILTERSGTDFGKDSNKWVDWFLSPSSTSPDNEKASIVTIRKIVNIEKKNIGKIADRNSESE